MSIAEQEARRASVVSAALIFGSIVIAAVAVIGAAAVPAAAALVLAVALAALTGRTHVSWPTLLVGLILVILFVPIRRYTLPGSLPFELEPYRLLVALLGLGWFASLLADPRTRLRATGFEAPLALILAASFASVVANPDRVARFSSVVDKKLMFLISFVVVLYLTASVVRRLDNIDYLAKTLVVGGAVVALFAIVESRNGFNVFNHLDRVLPFLQPGGQVETEAFQKHGAARLRVFASAQHPIALSAALVLLTPLALYLARRFRQLRWLLCAVVLVAGCAATVSRTGVLMLFVVGVVFLWLRPRETLRAWPALLLALLFIKFAMPGTLGALKQSFLPAGGLIAEQQSMAGEVGSGRLADLGPSLNEWQRQPLLGQGFATRVVDPESPRRAAAILDNQWLGTLLEIGAIGLLGWLWLFVRAIRKFGAEARSDDSERGWLLAALAASIAAYAVGMFTYDAFSFVQVTFVLFILIGLGGALIDAPTPAWAGVRKVRSATRIRPAFRGADP